MKLEVLDIDTIALDAPTTEAGGVGIRLRFPSGRSIDLYVVKDGVRILMLQGTMLEREELHQTGSTLLRLKVDV